MWNSACAVSSKSQLVTDIPAKTTSETGFRWLLTGFASGSPRILQNIKQKSTREKNPRCVDIGKRHGLKVKALMSIGHPGGKDVRKQLNIPFHPSGASIRCEHSMGQMGALPPNILKASQPQAVAA